eukprot:351721-Chlamydomonas_euryale.AAC.4
MTGLSNSSWSTCGKGGERHQVERAPIRPHARKESELIRPNTRWNGDHARAAAARLFRVALELLPPTSFPRHNEYQHSVSRLVPGWTSFAGEGAITPAHTPAPSYFHTWSVSSSKSCVPGTSPSVTGTRAYMTAKPC